MDTYHPRTVIVGNAPSVMNRKLGNVIDSFDRVVRINSFELKGYEEFTGIKTDIWAINQHWMTSGQCWCKNHVGDAPTPYFLCPFDGYSNYDDLMKKIHIMDHVKVIPRETAFELSQAFDPSYSVWPSTGLCAVWYFKPCVIIGFDFFVNGYEHYCNKHKDPYFTGHSHERELSFFKQLEKQQMVSFL